MSSIMKIWYDAVILEVYDFVSKYLLTGGNFNSMPLAKASDKLDKVCKEHNFEKILERDGDEIILRIKAPNKKTLLSFRFELETYEDGEGEDDN